MLKVRPPHRIDNALLFLLPPLPPVRVSTTCCSSATSTTPALLLLNGRYTAADLVAANTTLHSPRAPPPASPLFPIRCVQLPASDAAPGVAVVLHAGSAFNGTSQAVSGRQWDSCGSQTGASGYVRVAQSLHILKLGTATTSVTALGVVTGTAHTPQLTMQLAHHHPLPPPPQATLNHTTKAQRTRSWLAGIPRHVIPTCDTCAPCVSLPRYVPTPTLTPCSRACSGCLCAMCLTCSRWVLLVA